MSKKIEVFHIMEEITVRYLCNDDIQSLSGTSGNVSTFETVSFLEVKEIDGTSTLINMENIIDIKVHSYHQETVKHEGTEVA